MENTLMLPDDAISTAALTFAKSNESAEIFNHSVRSYLFAKIYANHIKLIADADYNDRLLLLACVLHDMGLTEKGDGDQRFEVDGADVAIDFMKTKLMSSGDEDAVWQAIALHTSGGIAERRGPIPLLTRAGIQMDFGGELALIVTTEQARLIFDAYPRNKMATCLTDVIVAQIQRKPQKGVNYSLPKVTFDERNSGANSSMEERATKGRWGN